MTSFPTNSNLDVSNPLAHLSTATIFAALTFGSVTPVLNSDSLQTRNLVCSPADLYANTCPIVFGIDNVSVIPKKSFSDRYAKLGRSNWFKTAYENKSIGEVVGIDE
jgi:hypothetical protein